MAKDGYKIRTSLDVGQLDKKINLKSTDEGVSFSPFSVITLRTILAYAGIVMLLVVLNLMKVFQHTDKFVTFGIHVMVVVITIFMVSNTKTGEPRYMQFRASRWYLAPGVRRLFTALDDKVAPFQNMMGYNVNPRGELLFNNGDVGEGYWIAGSASILMFREVANGILDHVDGFWRNVEPGVTIKVYSIREAQRVDLPVKAHNLRFKALQEKVHDETTLNLLADLLDDDIDVLTGDIQNYYLNTQQYLIIRCRDRETLGLFKRNLDHHLQQQATVIRRVRRMTRDDLIRLNKTLYRYDKVEAR